MLINEVLGLTIYRWLPEQQLLDYINRQLIPASWHHYIASEKRTVTGSSWSKDQYKWSLDMPYCIVGNLSKIKNKHFEIHGETTYLQSKAHEDNMPLGSYDHELEGVDLTPDEVFIEGPLKFNKLTIEKLLIRGHKTSAVSQFAAIQKKLKALGINCENI